MRIALRFCIVTLLLLVSAVLARARVFSGVDVMTSTVMQQHQTSFSGLSARVGLRSARIVEGFDLLPYVEYWRNSARIEVLDHTITSTRKDATLGADARYSFPREGWRPYVGAGLGIHFLSTEVDAPSLGLDHANDSMIKGGLSALAGITFPLSSHLDNFMELKYHHLPGYSQLKINMGIAWKL
jgi:opacity protein-like surface antigen